jgi:hypothetical protein
MAKGASSVACAHSYPTPTWVAGLFGVNALAKH